jgi:hypothetical protein
MPARTLNVLLGVWLFISAFAWPHTLASFTNTWIVGLLVAIFALIAMRAPAMRYVDTALAIWLFVATFLLPHSSVGTLWNNALCAIAIFLLSLVPGTLAGPVPRRVEA